MSIIMYPCPWWVYILQHTLCSYEVNVWKLCKDFVSIAPMAATDKTISTALFFLQSSFRLCNFDILNFKSSFNYFFKIQHLYAHFILLWKTLITFICCPGMWFELFCPNILSFKIKTANMLGIGIQSKTTWGYRLQKNGSAILFWPNMQVLVYGNGPINLKHKTFFYGYIKRKKHLLKNISIH
jgi:hypothetical protein